MKKLVLIGLAQISVWAISFAQQPFTNTNPGGIASGQNNQQFWSRAGNTGTLGTNNVFGTQAGFNSGIYTITNGITRTRLNGTLTTPINSVNQNVDGYFGIGRNNYFATNSPWSMLHLEGGNNTVFGGNGWRAWMNTGVFMKENSDAMYVGLKQEPAIGGNRSDAIINWSDDAVGTGGPDNLRVIFTGASNSGAGNCTNCPTNPQGSDGREIARFTPGGFMGIGPLFTSLQQPQSQIHILFENNLSAWSQISNQGVGVNATDGLRIGILGDPAVAQNGNAFIYNQEDRHLIFSTNAATPAAMNATNERMRVTSVGAPTNLPAAGYGVYNPGGLGTSDTRVSISLLQAFPVTRPLSLLHLGFNAGTAGPPNSTDGWRPWMGIGTFTSSGSDHVFVGVKTRGSGPVLLDNYDAIINWGDNQPASAPTGIGPDRLRFIFTANPLTPGNSGPAVTADGIEGMRMSPTGTSVFVGVGDDAPTNNTYTGAGGEPGNSLEINSTAASANVLNGNGLATGFSGVRLTDLNAGSIPRATNPGAGVLAVDANGDIIYVVAGTNMQFFQCNTGNTNANLPFDAEYNLNNHNFIFHDNGIGSGNNALNNVGIGLASNNCTPLAKLEVRQSSGFVPVVGSPGSIGILSRNTDVDGIAIKGVALGGVSTTTTITKIGGWFEATPTNGSEQTALFTPQGGGFILFNYPYATTFNPACRLDVAGSVCSNGTALTSDATLKTNVVSLNNALSTVKQLRGVSFSWITPLDSGMTGTHFGFIAQEVDSVIPNVVQTNAAGKKAVAYTEVIPLLVEAIKQLDSTVVSQRNMIDSLQVQVIGCCSNSRIASTSGSSTEVHLSNNDNIVLNQNTPNPFAEQTVISYYLPESVIKAQLLFYDGAGKLIKVVDLNNRGEGQINVFADDLSNGIYSYALVADGQIADSKKMIKSK